ncbi:MAG: ribonuclease J [Myxococcales bacterium]|nr:ribonuclease J [Myxococcales bacterium]
MMSTNEELNIVPLGGLGHVGGNMMVYETANDMVVVDCGVLFPGEEHPGVDYIIPDFSYVGQKRDKLRAVVLTHGHEDHLGAVPYFLRSFDVPVYGTHFTLELLRQKYDKKGREDLELRRIRDYEDFQIGSFHFHPIPVTHSIPDAVSLAIKTPTGTVIHTGDFRFDPTPIDGRVSGFEAYERFGKEGVLALLSDSTNSEKTGQTWSEQEIDKNIKDVVARAPERVLVTPFASHIHRIQSFIDAASASDRQIVVVGRSMRQNIEMSLREGYLKAPGPMFFDASEYDYMPRSKVMIIASGTQGEARSAMTRIAAGAHKEIHMDPGDWVVFSSRRIPGNERAVGELFNQYMRIGVKVIDDRAERIHTSGHAFEDEQAKMLQMCKPKYFIPVHGEYRHMRRHGLLAEKLGWSKNHILNIEDGTPICIREEEGETRYRYGEPVPVGKVFVEGRLANEVDSYVLRDRLIMSDVGVVFCSVALNGSGKLLSTPTLITRGVVHEDINQPLLQSAIREVEGALRPLVQVGKDEELEQVMRRSLKKFFRRELDAHPLILPKVLRINS